MARKSGSTISQEELYPPPELREEDLHNERLRHEELDDARLLDLDVDEESPFLRGQKRVSVRRGTLPKKTATGLAWTALAAFLVFVCLTAVAALYHYGERSWRFRIQSGDDIEISGLQNVTRAQVMEIMGADIGRNVFFISLGLRKAQLEQIPWVQSASVMRFVPNRLQVQINERVPIAFARIGSKIFLIDEVGTLMDLPATRKKYSFPVVLGMNAGEPASTRKARMKIYNQLVSQLDGSGAHYSQDLSEVDLSDVDDVKVLANNVDGNVLVHLGSARYLERYKVYVAHVKEWRQQFERVDSVDLRYDGQIVVNPDSEGTFKQATISNAAARKAIAASVRPAAFISHETMQPRVTTSSLKPHGLTMKSAVQRKSAHTARRKMANKKNVARTTFSRTATAKTSGKLAVKQQAGPVATNAGLSQPLNNARRKPSPAILKQQEQ